MKTKHQFRARVKQKNFDYLVDYQIINEFTNIGETLDTILEEHKELKKNNWSLNYISKTVANEVNETLSKEINRVRLGTNNTDRNTQILIELVQALMQMNNLDVIPTTDIFKPDFLILTEELIQKRITSQKQKKDSKKYNKKSL